MAFIEHLHHDAIELLKRLIKTPSLSRQEEKTAAILFDFLKEKKLQPKQHLNNVYCTNKHYCASKINILIASHHDTVPPCQGYTKDPFDPIVVDDKLYGLGSNDAGGCLVTLLALFIHLYERKDLHFNLIWAGVAEEEVSGSNGIAALLPLLPKIDLAIMGEPTDMDIAIAEKGLIVIDGMAQGQAGHAARNEGINAIYKAMKDIQKIESFQFEKCSHFLGPIKVTATQINAGKAHNVVPEKCEFVLDVRTTDAYTNEETLQILQHHLDSKLTARSLRLHPSFIDEKHPLVQIAIKNGARPYGSPTLSDQALCHNIPSFKMAPGSSERSHRPDEFVKISEIKQGIESYIKIFETYNKELGNLS